MLEIKNIVPPTGEDFEKALEELYEINGIPYDDSDSFWEVENGENANFYIGDEDIELLASSVKEETKAHVLESIPVKIEMAAHMHVWNVITKYVPYGKVILYTSDNDCLTGKIELNYFEIKKMLKHQSPSKEWIAFVKELLCLPYAYRIFEKK